MNPNAALIYLATIRLRREQREKIARMKLEAVQKGWTPRAKVTKF